MAGSSHHTLGACEVGSRKGEYLTAMNLSQIRNAIIDDQENRAFRKRGWLPIYTASPKATVLIVGQAPGKTAQGTGIPWNDPSGDNLRGWLGLSREIFYDEHSIALVPMDFFFPGSKERGDLPPRKGFAEKWHPHILKQLPNIRLTLLVGQYAQKFYLGKRTKKTLSETVWAYREFLPEFVPLVHPSPRNNIWQKQHPWFQNEMIPKLQELIQTALSKWD